MQDGYIVTSLQVTRRKKDLLRKVKMHVHGWKDTLACLEIICPTLICSWQVQSKIIELELCVPMLSMVHFCSGMQQNEIYICEAYDVNVVIINGRNC